MILLSDNAKRTHPTLLYNSVKVDNVRRGKSYLLDGLSGVVITSVLHYNAN